MQTLACNPEGKVVQAESAARHLPYTCLECGAPLRLRAGHRRRPHFYHLSRSPCRLQTRSTFHVQIQNFLQQQLAPENTFLEHPFPNIRRIADLVWPAKQWIFEIQCSPISAEEVEARMRDYSSVGYRVIWILFDRQFKRYALSDAERFLQPHPYYFISKELFLYEQRFHIAHGKRIARSPVYPIHLKHLDLNVRRAWSPTLSQTARPPRKLARTLFASLLEKMCD